MQFFLVFTAHKLINVKAFSVPPQVYDNLQDDKIENEKKKSN